MKIVEPEVTLYRQLDDNEHIAKCARICYASKKIDHNDEFCEALWNNKHRSMFRHAGVYYIIPEHVEIDYRAYIGSTVKVILGTYYISTNKQCAREYWDKRYSKYRISLFKAFNHPIFNQYKMLRYSFCVETGIDITREYNRKSPNNIAEQSTRYVDFIKKIGIKFKKCHWMYKCNLYRTLLYKFMLKTTEWFYKIARNKYGLNLPPQDARFILPLDTMSKAVYTYTVAEWEYIINMREYDWTGKAHEDARIVAKLIHDKFRNLGIHIEDYSLLYNEEK